MIKKCKPNRADSLPDVPEIALNFEIQQLKPLNLNIQHTHKTEIYDFPAYLTMININKKTNQNILK
mgnify:FL=1